MTLKQKRFLKELPKNKFNVSESMKKAGYSDATSVAGTQYKRLRRITSQLDYYSEESIKREQMKALRKFRKANDNTNHQRAVEHMAKMSGIIIDKAQVDNKNPDKLIIIHEKQKT